jgi:hypothetical protein
MLVTFHTKAWSSITMFGDVAVALLKMAGHSGTVPSALRAEDLPVTIARLQRALAAIPDEKASPDNKSSGGNDQDPPPPVSLRVRAYPLIELLSAAAQQECDVTWEAGAPVI